VQSPPALRLLPLPVSDHHTAEPIPAPRRPVQAEGTVQIRVRYCECDSMGVAHHAAYIPWLEIGRTELLRDAGVTYAQLEEAGVFLVVAKLGCRYRRPIYYDDLVEVRTRVVGGSRVKIEHEYEIVVIENGRSESGDRTPRAVLFAASSTLACVGRDGKIRTLPEWLIPGEAPERPQPTE
jgi:acyl-CoA thioester hydrolase